jgi:hypothetical protein
MNILGKKEKTMLFAWHGFRIGRLAMLLPADHQYKGT